MINQDTRIIDLTVAQLAEVIDKAVEESLSRRSQPTEDNSARYVYGIKGIATLLGVSERTARYVYGIRHHQQGHKTARPHDRH